MLQIMKLLSPIILLTCLPIVNSINPKEIIDLNKVLNHQGNCEYSFLFVIDMRNGTLKGKRSILQYFLDVTDNAHCN